MNFEKAHKIMAEMSRIPKKYFDNNEYNHLDAEAKRAEERFKVFIDKLRR